MIPIDQWSPKFPSIDKEGSEPNVDTDSFGVSNPFQQIGDNSFPPL